MSQKILKGQRGLPFIKQILLTTFVLLPFSTFIYFPGTTNIIFKIAYWVTFIYFLGWHSYILRFIFLLPIELPLYFFKRKKSNFLLKIIFAYTFFYTFVALLYSNNPAGVITVFVIPTLICWFALMAGNWTQHAFVSSEDPYFDYQNSITVVDSIYSKHCFNDGHHIGPHLFPGMHWTVMPAEIEKNKEKYKPKRPLAFRTLDSQLIWFLLMFKEHKKLANYYVGNESKESVVELKKQCLKPCPAS